MFFYYLPKQLYMKIEKLSFETIDKIRTSIPKKSLNFNDINNTYIKNSNNEELSNMPKDIELDIKKAINFCKNKRYFNLMLQFHILLKELHDDEDIKTINSCAELLSTNCDYKYIEIENKLECFYIQTTESITDIDEIHNKVMTKIINSAIEYCNKKKPKKLKNLFNRLVELNITLFDEAREYSKFLEKKQYNKLKKELEVFKYQLFLKTP